MLRHNAIEAWETMQKSGGWLVNDLEGKVYSHFKWRKQSIFIASSYLLLPVEKSLGSIYLNYLFKGSAPQF